MKQNEHFRFAQRVNERGASTSAAGVRSIAGTNTDREASMRSSFCRSANASSRANSSIRSTGCAESNYNGT